MTEPNENAADQAVEATTGEADLHETLGIDKKTPSFEFDAPVNPEQLLAELTEAGAEQVFVVLAEGVDSPYDTSAERPATVYVVGGTKKKVSDAIDAHEADPNFGVTPEAVAETDAIAKVLDPETTPTLEDLTAAVRALLNPPVPAPVEEPV